MIHKISNIVILPISVLFVLSMALVLSPRVGAVSGSEFNAGRIIEDSLFFNGESMNVEQIQAFLNSKVPSCDTWGQQPYAGTTRAAYGASRGNPAPYTCLRDYRQNTGYKAGESGLCSAIEAKTDRTAAQIIDDVARACHISQKVLLVMLQKEQGLITDDWPWDIQYRGAMGYGCPDTAPCDAEYYGFFNQVYNAALQFQRYKADPFNWNHVPFMNNQVLYQANAPSCGSRSVYIENYATAGLYNYTPYTPNQPALDNLYGLGDACSAYGNRNFWRYYNDWFGSTQGALVRTESSGSLFLVDNGKRFIVPSMELVAQYSLTNRDVRFVTDSFMADNPLASSPLSSVLGQVVKSESDTDEDGGGLYLVSNGRRYPFNSMTQFANFGYTGDDITYLPLSVISRVPRNTANLSDFVQAPDGAIAKMESGKKRAVFELGKLQAANPSGNISSLSSFTFNQLTYGKAWVDGSYAIIGPDSGIRLYSSSGNYQSINSMNIHSCLGIEALKTFRITNYVITNGTKLGSINSCIITDSSAGVYLMAKTKKYSLPGYTNPSTPYTIDDDHSAKLSTATLPSNPVKSASSSAVGVIESNKIRYVISADSFNKLGYSWSQITTLPDAAIASLPVSDPKIAIGTVIINPSGAVEIVTNNDTRGSIPSMQLFEHFSLDEAATYRTKTALNQYSSTGNLSHYLKTSAGLYLVDKGVRYLVEESLDASLGLDRSTLPLVDSRSIQYTTLPWKMTQFIKSSDNPAVYELVNGSKRPLSSWDVFMRQSQNQPSKLVVLSSSAVNRYPTGAPIN